MNTAFYAIREGLAIVKEETLEARWERHRRNHEAFVAGIEAMGLSMHVAEGHRPPVSIALDALRRNVSASSWLRARRSSAPGRDRVADRARAWS